MTRLFTIHEFNEETPVQYVGVYVLAWRGEWGEPTAMFAEVDDPVYDAAKELLAACKTALSELEHAHSVTNDAWNECDSTTQAMLINALPEREDSVIPKLTTAIARAEGEQ